MQFAPRLNYFALHGGDFIQPLAMQRVELCLLTVDLAREVELGVSRLLFNLLKCLLKLSNLIDVVLLSEVGLFLGDQSQI